ERPEEFPYCFTYLARRKVAVAKALKPPTARLKPCPDTRHEPRLGRCAVGPSGNPYRNVETPAAGFQPARRVPMNPDQKRVVLRSAFIGGSKCSLRTIRRSPCPAPVAP